MKWEVLEPTRGTYNWAPADELIDFARKNKQLVRGHVLVWHNQLPAWLTAGRHRRHDQRRRSCGDPEEAHHRRGRALQGQDLAVGRGQRGGQRPVGQPADDPPTRASGRITSAPATSPTRSAGPARPTRRRCCSTTTTTSRRSATAARATRPSLHHGQAAARAAASRSTASAARVTSAPSTATTTPSRSPTALERFADLGLATAFTEVDVRSQLTDGVQAGRLQRDQPPAQASAGQLQRAAAGVPGQPALPVVHGLGLQRQALLGARLVLRPAEGLATLYDENYQPKRAYNAVKADLAFSGPPYVLPRIPQKPRR